MGFAGGALGSLVLFLVKSVLVGVTLGSHTKKKLKIVDGVFKLCLLPEAYLPTSARCFLSEVWPHILGGVGWAHGGSGGDGKFGNSWQVTHDLCPRTSMGRHELWVSVDVGSFQMSVCPVGHVSLKGSIRVASMPC